MFFVSEKPGFQPPYGGIDNGMVSNIKFLLNETPPGIIMTHFCYAFRMLIALERVEILLHRLRSCTTCTRSFFVDCASPAFV